MEGKFLANFTELKSYKSKNYGDALIEAFKLMDELIKNSSKELNETRGVSQY